MQNYESIRDCLTAALSDNAQTDAVLQQDEGVWQVILGREMVTVEADLPLRRVGFSIQSLDEFDKISPEKLILMLQYSFVWRATSGVYFSMTDNEQPVLMIYFNLDEIDAPVVRNVVFGLIEKFSIWKDVLK